MQRYERFECDLSQDGYAEWPESYLDRGFCPISVGQVVGGDEPHSYEIVAKLGHGGFSTVVRQQITGPCFPLPFLKTEDYIQACNLLRSSKQHYHSKFSTFMSRATFI